jgi:hypothetical protein
MTRGGCRASLAPPLMNQARVLRRKKRREQSEQLNIKASKLGLATSPLTSKDEPGARASPEEQGDARTGEKQQQTPG